MGRIQNLWVLLGLVLFTVSICEFHVRADVIPSENECRPYIEKAIHELKNVEATTGTDEKESTEASLDDNDSKQESTDSIENEAVTETGDDGNSSAEDNEKSLDEENKTDDTQSEENQTVENASVVEPVEGETAEDSITENESKQEESAENDADDKSNEAAQADDGGDSKEPQANDDGDSKEQPEADESHEQAEDSKEAEGDSKEAVESNPAESQEGDSNEADDDDSKESDNEAEKKDDDSIENATEGGDDDSKENVAADDANDRTQTEENLESSEPTEQVNEESNEESTEGENAPAESLEDAENQTAEDDSENKTNEDDGDSKEDEATTAEANDDSKEKDDLNESQETQNDTNEEESKEETVRAKRSIPDEAEAQSDEQQESAQDDTAESQETANESIEAESAEAAPEVQEGGNESQEVVNESQENSDYTKEETDDSQEEAVAEKSEEDNLPEEDLTMEFEIPKNLRPHGHVSELLGLDAESSIKENALKRTGEVILKDLKRVFDSAIKPLETMYKYRDLSNRHFGDPEIFSKPLILFMGPWSGGKSTILNYLTENEYTPNSIRSGAEPSPAYFNILMYGDKPEVLDGDELAADYTFSGLQKFGQGLMDRLRGQKLPSKLLERVNIVEIPGILEVRKHVSRYFPFNDACQWFIDRADIIFLVYDPSKLDVGPETEAILDQLKGREYQTRILLNKADQVKPEELLRVQSALIWNISPLMSSAQPPVMYTVSLWSHPYEIGAPIRLLQAQERALLTDLREAIDRRIENKIASARRFAVRIRNHAKMVDCYLTTYYNQKGLFSNKKQVSDKIIEHPQNYNIYEGLSTLTNISRYDLPGPEVYLDFFRLNPLYEFKKLSETCTYFKGCPINKLDIAIAYELPELVGKYKKLLEQNLLQLRKEYDENCNQTEPQPPVKIINSR